MARRTLPRVRFLFLVSVATFLLAATPGLWAQQAPAPEAEGTPGEAPAPTAPGERLGEVVGTVVNVRSGPGIAYRAATKVLRGAQVTILGDQDGWLKIVMPENEYSWVAGHFIEKGTAGVGTVTGDGVNVRTEPNVQSDVLGQLDRGVQVRVVEEREGWCRIAPVPGSIGWVSADFIRDVSGGPVVAVTVSASQAGERFAELEALFKAEVDKPEVADWELKKLVPLYQALARGSADREISNMATNRLSQIAVYQAFVDQRLRDRQMKAELKDELEKLERRYQAVIDELRRAARQPRYVATGVLKKLAISFLPPATHKMEGDGRILFLLYSTDIDLTPYVGKHVGLQGTMTVPKGWETALVRVTKVEIITP